MTKKCYCIGECSGYCHKVVAPWAHDAGGGVYALTVETCDLCEAEQVEVAETGFAYRIAWGFDTKYLYKSLNFCQKCWEQHGRRGCIELFRKGVCDMG